jgi:hypothetical protein
MQREANIHQSLQRLKQTADTTFLSHLHMNADIENGILERVRTETTEDATRTKHPRRNLVYSILFAFIVTAGLTAVGVINSRHNYQQTVRALETSVAEISPVAAALGVLMVKDALRTVDGRLNSRATLALAN